MVGREDTAARAPATVRPHVWEPVMRRVAVALCALKECGQDGAKPHLRLETEERLAGSRVRTLAEPGR
jgi:hypothetical protein